MGNAALLPSENLFTKVGDLPVNIQILAFEVAQLRSQREYFCPQTITHFERCGAGVIIHLADFVGRGIRIIANADLNKFGCAASKSPAKRDFSGLPGWQ